MNYLDADTWPVAGSFFVPGTPRPERRSSARVNWRRDTGGPLKGGVRHAGRVFFATLYHPRDSKYREWKRAIETVAAAHRPASPLAGAVVVKIVCLMPRPQRLMRSKDPAGPIPHIVVPDSDNLSKITEDAMTQAGWWNDDCQVFDLRSIKLYAAKDGQTGVHVTVRAAELVTEQMALRGEEALAKIGATP